MQRQKRKERSSNSRGKKMVRKVREKKNINIEKEENKTEGKDKARKEKMGKKKKLKRKEVKTAEKRIDMKRGRKQRRER